jgi:hypothetical protein
MYMFSIGQANRMQAIFAAYQRRASLLTSNGCGQQNSLSCSNKDAFGLSGIIEPVQSYDHKLHITFCRVYNAEVYSVLGENVAEW